MSAAKHKKIYNFHQEWEEQFFVIVHHGKCVPSLCIGLCFTTVHNVFQWEVPVDSELRKKKLSNLKSKLE